MRISLRPNANYLRYTMTQDRKAAGAALFSKVVEVGVGKEGEKFAGGTAEVDRPKCIVTGGLATMSVTFEGSTFALCCSGCRDEFNDNPQKYVKKATLMLAKEAEKPKSTSASPKKRPRGCFRGGRTTNQANQCVRRQRQKRAKRRRPARWRKAAQAKAN